MNIAVFGLQMGDEGKARVVNYFAKNYDYIIRFSGSGNAGHTIYHNGKKIIRHLIPSADFSTSHNKAFLGAGMVIHLEDLLKEVLETEEMFPGSASRIIVDPDAFVVYEKHIEEDKANNGHIGSTNKGVTPAYKDKIGRVGIKIRSLIKDNSEIIQALEKLGVQFKYVLELKEQMEISNLLFEGSQSIQLDLNFGTYPFVTSGDCGLGGIFNAGFAFAPPTKVYGIAKCYITKAGGGVGKFITELPEEEAQSIREKGNEIGATTNRPRRIGALDLPALKYSITKGGVTHLVLTKLDIINGQEKIKTCYDYGKSVFSGNDFEDATPHYTNLPGWKDAKDLTQVRPFIKHIEDYTGTKVEYISAGVDNDDVINLNPPTLSDVFENPEATGFIKYGDDLFSEVSTVDAAAAAKLTTKENKFSLFDIMAKAKTKNV
jgi:adenylosuccinate synthase